MLRLAMISAALALVAFALRNFTRGATPTAEALDEAAGATADAATAKI